MAVFFDNGGGDIYAGETKEQCLDAMRKDVGDDEFADFEQDIEEVDGSTEKMVENEDGSRGGEKRRTLNEEYTNMGHGYCIASSNC